jgi:hypothetical protein
VQQRDNPITPHGLDGYDQLSKENNHEPS